MKLFFLRLGVFVGIIGSLWLVGKQQGIYSLKEDKHQEEEKGSGAGIALDAWSMARTYPYDRLYMGALSKGFVEKKQALKTRGPKAQAKWKTLGPHNVGGRTLALAVHPINPDILFAGAASGGLWKSTTAGISFEANGGINYGWQRIETGFPVLSVSAIAINPANPDEMYIGTGEVYNTELAMPSVYNRFTRGTYGIGILKSNDGGKTWKKSLDWSQQDLRGVSTIAINPKNPKTVWASTSHGVYRSYNAGVTWTQVFNQPMAVDLDINKADTAVVVVTHGSYYNEGISGIYRTINNGGSFTKVTKGLPTSYSGKAVVGMGTNDPSVFYAYLSDVDAGIGLYRSENAGDSWTKVNNRNITQWQGWYSCDLIVDPKDANVLYITGIDVYKSVDRGETIAHMSAWEGFYLDQKLGVLDREGEPTYVHADIHAAVFHPTLNNNIYFATDGGIFVTQDGAKTFDARNGGYQTTQFYANFQNSTTDKNFAIGGTQDNATLIFDGSVAWTRTLGGDGMNTAINPENDQIVYASRQYFDIHLSENRGYSWQSIKPDVALTDNVSFNTPFVLAPSDPNVIYAGGNRVFISENFGKNWRVLTPSPVDGENTILTIAVSPQDPTLLYLSTAPTSGFTSPKVLKSNGGRTWTRMQGLPDRVAMDIAIHPLDARIVYVAFSGFNTQHLYKTQDDGQTWFPVDLGFPDVSINTVVLDPLAPEHVYVGTDLGIYYSLDGGVSWASYSDGLPDVIMAMDLSISPSNRKLRLATHGNGVYEGNLALETVSTAPDLTSLLPKFSHYPNPVQAGTTFEVSLTTKTEITLELLDLHGRPVKNLIPRQSLEGDYQQQVDLSQLPAGTYIYSLFGKTADSQRTILTSRKLIKQ